MNEPVAPLLPTASLSGTNEREDNSVKAGQTIHLQDSNILQPHSPSDSAYNPSHPAAVVQTQQSVPSQPSSASFNSYNSIQTWLNQTSSSIESPTATSTSLEHVQVNHAKRKRSTSPEFGQPQLDLTVPLTRKALKQHLLSTMSSDQSNLPNQVFTPTRNASTNTSSYQTPVTPANPSKTSARNLPPSDVRDHMEVHRMFFDKNLIRKPEMKSFRDLVMNVVDTERPSGRKPESEERWQTRTDRIRLHNEATILDHILPLMIKDGRQVPIQGPSTEAESTADEQVYNSLWEDFEKSGLDWTLDREFARTYLPNTYHNIGYEERIATALAKERGMKNPKPDRAYGLAINDIRPPKHNPVLLRDGTRDLLNAIPGLQHVFFLMEGVRSAGDLNKAFNQACRGGAVAVNIQRLLLEAIGEDIMQEGPDRQTYVYTATLDNNAMYFWVNYAHVTTAIPSGEKIVDFHMDHIYSCTFRSDDAELLLRRVCHNILDWGVRSRRPTLEARCSKMYQVEQQMIDRDVQEAQAQTAAAAAAAAAAKAAQEQASGNKKRKMAPGSVSQTGR
ncbi:MAG: hypothetical protein Q9219_007352 [cf. Caloplaca sp. 3 TL-2023]